MAGADRAIIIKTKDEACRVVKTAEGKTIIWVGAVGALPIAEGRERLLQDETLDRYAQLVCRALTDGRRVVVQEQNRR